MSVAKPPIEFVGTKGRNIWVGRGIKKIAIVNHIMAGSMDACIAWFQTDPATVPNNPPGSSNYGIGKDGRIVCFVDPFGKDAPFANGLVNQPSAAASALIARMGGVNPNYWTISKEHEGQPGDLMPAAQVHASAQLTAWLCEQFSIPFDENHDLGHYEFDNVTRHNCPGWSHTQWLEYEAAVNAILAPAPAPQPQPDPLVPRVAALEAEVATLSAEYTTVIAQLGAIRKGLVNAGS